MGRRGRQTSCERCAHASLSQTATGSRRATARCQVNPQAARRWMTGRRSRIACAPRADACRGSKQPTRPGSPTNISQRSRTSGRCGPDRRPTARRALRRRWQPRARGRASTCPPAVGGPARPRRRDVAAYGGPVWVHLVPIVTNHDRNHLVSLYWGPFWRPPQTVHLGRDGAVLRLPDWPDPATRRRARPLDAVRAPARQRRAAHRLAVSAAA